MAVVSMEELEMRLGGATETWIRLLNYIRTCYVMDEIWDGNNELKLRRGGRTFATFYVQDGYFVLLLIFGKAERAAFETVQDTFAPEIRQVYQDSRTYHDGKWMHFAVRDGSLLEEYIRLMHIKKKPNRKSEKRKGEAIP